MPRGCDRDATRRRHSLSVTDRSGLRCFYLVPFSFSDRAAGPYSRDPGCPEEPRSVASGNHRHDRFGRHRRLCQRLRIEVCRPCRNPRQGTPVVLGLRGARRMRGTGVSPRERSHGSSPRKGAQTLGVDRRPSAGRTRRLRHRRCLHPGRIESDDHADWDRVRSEPPPDPARSLVCLTLRRAGSWALDLRRSRPKPTSNTHLEPRS